MFATKFQECGGVCCYAEDSTYTVVGDVPVDLSDKLTSKYAALADFLTENGLKVNDDKTPVSDVNKAEEKIQRHQQSHHQHSHCSNYSIVT